MPEEYVITGTIPPAEGLDPDGFKVQAFERELPSLELRKPTQQLGKDGTTDANGRFQITYTLDEFQANEGLAPLARYRQKNADLSFRVIDTIGQPLAIKRIKALDREFGPDDIIFNAPARLEVSILLHDRPESGDSEYERLLAQIIPVVQDLPLAELTDDDIVFVINELGFEQKLETQQHIEWLRRSALLAQETNLIVEAFYGWGRKDKPAALAELVTMPLKDLKSVLTKLISLPDEELRSALIAAIDKDIIPASLRARMDEIIRQLKRLDHVGLITVVAQLKDEETKASLVGYSVTTFDKDAGDENRGLDITDGDGKFSFDYYVPHDLPSDAPARKFSFQVTTPAGEAVPVGEPTAINPTTLETDIVVVKIKVSTPQRPPVEEQLQKAQLQAPDALLEWLRGKEIRTFADIRRKGGLSRLPDLPQLDPAMISTVESLADLDRVSSNVQVSKTLLDKGYNSVLAIADAPYSEFVSLVSEEKPDLTVLDVAKLHVMATVQTNLLNNILIGMAADVANGFDLPAPK